MTEQSKFKVGDVVKVMSLPGPKWSMEVGETFKIDQLDERGAHKNVVCGTYFIPLAHIELVSALEPTAKWKEIDRNETHVLFEANCGGIVQCIGRHGDTGLGLSKPSQVSGVYRAQLGKRGYRYTRDGDFTNAITSPDYVPRDPRLTAAKVNCASCSAPFTPAATAEYSDTSRCVYCQHQVVASWTDSSGTKRPPAFPDRAMKRAPNKHDARPIDLEQAWSTPGWES